MGEIAWHLGALALPLVILTGLDAPLGALALALLVANGAVTLRPEFAGLTAGWLMAVYGLLAAAQVAADWYFIPIRARDQRYLDPRRTLNAYLHSRFQSLLRPLAAALVLAALPTNYPTQPIAVVGFVLGAAVYWFSAWVREYAAITRGTLVLVLLETVKHIALLGAALLLLWLPLAALAWLAALLLPTALWTLRLQREHALIYPAIGGDDGTAL